MTNMKKMMLVGLFALGCLMTSSKSEAGTYFTTRSTGAVISSGTPFNVTGIHYSSAATFTLNAHYFVLIDTDGYHGQDGAASFNVCEGTFPVSQRIIAPTYFASSHTATTGNQVFAPTEGMIYFPGSGITVEGLVICQSGGTGGNGGQVTIYTEPAGSRSRNQPW